MVDHLQVDAGSRFAHRAVAGFDAGETATEQDCFCLPISIPDDHTGGIMPRLDNFRIERLPCTDTVAQIAKITAA